MSANNLQLRGTNLSISHVCISSQSRHSEQKEYYIINPKPISEHTHTLHFRPTVKSISNTRRDSIRLYKYIYIIYKTQIPLAFIILTKYYRCTTENVRAARKLLKQIVLDRCPKTERARVARNARARATRSDRFPMRPFFRKCIIIDWELYVYYILSRGGATCKK